MQFLKKNYEKVLLGLVLLGLVGAVAFLPFLVKSEKDAQRERRLRSFSVAFDQLPEVDLSQFEKAVKMAQTPLDLDFSSTNKLFNPVRWQKKPDGTPPFPNPVGSELDKLEITKVVPLYLVISFDSVITSDSASRYVIMVEQQAAAQRSQQYRKPNYVSVGDKKDVFTLKEVKGPPEAPVSLVLELNETGEMISISKDKPFKRVDGYKVDMRYPPESKSFLNRRVGDAIVVVGERYNIVAISQNEVVLSAPNGKKYTIRYNAAP